MGLEVANLKATIAFAAKGEAQAKRAAESVEKAVKSVGLSMDAVSSKAAVLDAKLQANASKLAAARAEYDSTKRAVAEYDSGLTKLNKTLTDTQAILDRNDAKPFLSSEDASALIQQEKATKALIEGYGTLEQRTVSLARATSQLESANLADLKLRDTQATKVQSEALRAYENQLKIATASTTTWASAQAAAVDEIQRVTSAGGNATPQIAALNDLIQQEADSANFASEATLKYGEAVAILEGQLVGATGTQAAALEKTLGHAKAAEEASGVLDKETKSVQELEAALKKLNAESARLKGDILRGGPGASGAAEKLGIVQDLSSKVKGALGGARGREAAALDKTNRSVGLLQRAFGRLGGIGAKAGAQLGGMVRSVSGIASASRGGVQGMSMLATSLGRLGPYAVAAAAALALIVKTLGLMKESQAVSHIAPLSETIRQIGEDALRTENQLKPLAQQVRNIFSAEGFTNVDALTDDVFKLGAAFQNLTPSGTLEESINIITSAIRGNVSELGKLSGVATGPYEAMLASMGPATTEAQRMQVITQMLTQQQVKSASDIASANANNEDSIERLAFAWKQLTDSIANSLAGPLGSFIIWLTDVVNGLTIVTEKVGDFIGKIDGLSTVFDKAFDAAKPLIAVLAPGTAALGWLASIGREGREAEEGAKAAEGAITGATDATSKWAREQDKLSQIQEARKDYKQFLDTVNQGQNAVGAVRNLGQALVDLEGSTPTPDKIFTLISAFNNVFSVAANGGLQALEAFEDFASRLDLGAEANAMIADMLAVTRDALGPAEDQLNTVGVAAENVQGPMNMAAGSFGAAGGAAGAAVGPVRDLEAALNSINGTYQANVVVNMPGGSFQSGTQFFSGGSGTTESSTRAPFGQNSGRGVSVTAPSTDFVPTGGSRFQPNRERAGDTEESRQAATESARISSIKSARDFPGISKGGGGGGGGGGTDDRNATIEEIRAFIEQVNKAVMAGIRGGVVFSTAGNAIPVGGPGEFVKNEGGTNIGTINLRGVWDFADPAAKREIVRQLQEALVQYQKEVA